MTSKNNGISAAPASTAQPGSVALDLAIDAGLALAADRQRQQNLTDTAAQTAIDEADAKTAVERLRELLAARVVLIAEDTVSREAVAADDRKWRLATVVSEAYAADPEPVRLAAVMAVLESNDPQDTAARLAAQRIEQPAPVVLGPGTDAPGHPAWCETHDSEVGDGTSVCFGEDAAIVEDLDDPHSPNLSAHLVQSTGEAPRMFIDARNDGSVSLAVAREYAELILELIAQAEAGSAVTE